MIDFNEELKNRLKNAIVNDSEDVPFELVVERFCRRYGYTPNQVLELEYDWITTFNAIATFDKEAQAKKRTLDKLNTTVKQHGR